MYWWLLFPVFLQTLGGGNLLRRIWEFLNNMSSDYREYLLRRDEREKMMWSAMDRAQAVIIEQRNRITLLEAALSERPAGVVIPQADYDELMRKESESLQHLTTFLQKL